MKGIILAGGSGTRLHPITLGTSKQLLPVYDKPMIYYPLSVLMLAGIRDIMIISTPQDLPRFEQLFQSGKQWGLNFVFAEQPKPEGIAQAFLIAEQFIGNDTVALVLGDNIFYGGGLTEKLRCSVQRAENDNLSSVYGYYVKDPERYGVVDFDQNMNAVSIQEKPSHPKSHYAVTGLYFYTNDVIAKSKSLKPSPRGELEITDVNSLFLAEGRLKVEVFGRGYAWLDTGTHDSLLDAGNFIKTIEERQGLKVACIEEIAYELGYIDQDALGGLVKNLMKTNYGKYIQSLIKHG